MTHRMPAEHGIVARLPGVKLGYFGWPTVAILDDGTLLVASSGLRSGHICPWGKTVLNASFDGGRSWSAPRVINDYPLDDRDAGLLSLGGTSLLVTWFTSDTRIYLADEAIRGWLGEAIVASWYKSLSKVTDDLAQQYAGSWAMRSTDAGVSWSPPARVPVSAPHGPIRLQHGDLLYLGKLYRSWQDMKDSAIHACSSNDDGRTWQLLGSVPLLTHTMGANYHEAHLVALPTGRVLGLIRLENSAEVNVERDAGLVNFSLLQTMSDDGGQSWSLPTPLGFHGSPPHLCRHSSGTLILSYGYRLPGYGQRVAISRDNGASWDHDWIIRDDGPDADLGYPSTAELADGSLISVYYQKVPGDTLCSLLYSRWSMPA